MKKMLLVLAIIMMVTVLPVSAQQSQCVTVNGNEICGEASFIASVIMSLGSGETSPAATATPVQPVNAVATPEVSAAFTGSADHSGWSLLQYPQYFDVVEVAGESWLLPLGTFYAVSTTNGRYEAVVSRPVGNNNGWCGAGQLDCPPQALLGRVSVPSGANVQAVMDISYRINLHNHDAVARPVRVQLRYNNVADAVRAAEAVSAPRTPAELLEDYNTLAREGDLGLFVAMKDSLMPRATLALDSFGYEIGYSCWDCLADTQGPSAEQPLRLNSPEMSRFGTPTPPLASSIVPGRVISIPSPADDANWAIDFEVLVPPNTTVVIWLGRYDVPDVVPTPTPTATPIS